MRFAWRALVLSALAVTGCAKFPANGTGTTYTRVSFRIKVAGKINTTQDADPLTNYLYFVAIRASSDDNPDSTTNPQPVFAVNPNGFVGGQPTHFVEFDTLNPTQQYPYRLYQFATTSDPANPINLGAYSEVAQPIVNFTRPDSGGAELKFDLFTNQLGDGTGSTALKFLQVNFLTMNKRLLSGTTGRLQDFLGDNNNAADLNKAIKVDLRTNDYKVNTSDYEPSGDVSDPDLDIVDWSVTVTRP